MASDDIERMKQQDAEKVREAVNSYRSDDSSWDLGATVEGVLWSCTAIAIIGMVAVMPWVGQGKAVAGRTWLGVSVGCIVLFGAAAMGTRYVREDLDTAAVDGKVESRLSGKR